MPRTKANGPKVKNELRTTLPAPVAKQLKAYITKQTNDMLKDSEKWLEQYKAYNQEMLDALLAAHSSLLNVKLEDLDKPIEDFMTSHSKAYSEESRSVLRANKQKRRSRSLNTPDEGYLTGGSSDSSSTNRTRSRSKAPTTTGKIRKRQSRSLSHIKASSTNSTFKTPMNRLQPVEFGPITPKIQPDIPHCVLRCPKVGEYAISMQGSPLMVNPLVTEHMANVNIPLANGNVYSIQPRRGLRTSQLPAMSTQMRDQILALKENLDKICSSAKFMKDN